MNALLRGSGVACFVLYLVLCLLLLFLFLLAQEKFLLDAAELQYTEAMYTVWIPCAWWWTVGSRSAANPSVARHRQRC